MISKNERKSNETVATFKMTSKLMMFQAPSKLNKLNEGSRVEGK